MSPDRRPFLYDLHVAAGAKIVPFGGWAMPLQYGSGTVAEHLACRRDAVVFDVSHLGTVRLIGDHLTALQGALSNDLTRIAPGRAQYTHLLNDRGGVEDDLIVWWIGAREFDVMPNASNTDRVRAVLGGEDVTAERCVLAVQGPNARARVATIDERFAAVKRFAVECVDWRGVEVRVAGTGYTGEDGVELAVPNDRAADLWTAVVDSGVTPAGLGARDTLRLEAALPLHGHELSASITPIEARLGWVIGWDKGPFTGREALEAQRNGAPHRWLVAVVADGRQPLREGAAVAIDGADGTLTSGNFSPVLERGIGLGFTSTDVLVGAAATVTLRGRSIGAAVVKPPFVRKAS